MRRLPGIPPKDWSRALIEVAATLTPPDGHPSADRSNKPKAMATMESFAHHPDLAAGFFPFNGHILYGTTLAPRLRGLLVLRVAARRQSAYLWSQHFFNGRDVGLSDEEMACIAFGPGAPFFGPLEAAALRAVDELIDDGVIADATWDELAAELDPQQLLDLIFTVGCYETVAFFMRSLNLEVDPAIPQLLEGSARET
jgi:alkylhydroperoxidase family enzyme